MRTWKKTTTKIIASIITCSILASTINIPVVHAENVITIDVTGIQPGGETTHDCTRYAKSEFDDTHHWTKCFVCDKILVDEKHTLQRVGIDSCALSAGYMYDRCDCGYSIQLPKKPHTPSNLIIGENHVAQHRNSCSSCGITFSHMDCVNSQGERLGCATGISGTCVVCGKYRYGNEHEYITNWDHNNNYANIKDNGTNIITTGNLYCYGCSINFGTFENKVYRVTELKTGIESRYNLLYNTSVNDSGMFHDCSSFFGADTQFVLNSKNYGIGFVEDKGYFEYSEKTTPPVYVAFCSATPHGSMIGYNGMKFMSGAHLHTNAFTRTDWDPPVIQGTPTLNYTNYVNLPGYNQPIATNLELSVKYYEFYCNNTWVRLIDSDGTTVIQDWKACQQNGDIFSASFGIIDEIIGTKTIYVEAKDEYGHISERTPITISNIDAKMPVLTFNGETSKEWSKTKDITITCIDAGFEELYIGFNHESKYIEADKVSSGNYEQKYTLTGDIYGKNIAIIYAKDAVGNDTYKYLGIYNLDNTSPTITNVSIDDNKTNIENNKMYVNASIESHDIKAGLGEGSGVTEYAVTKSKTDTPNWNNNQVQKVYEPGTYYAWTKDLVGNISEPYEFKVEFPTFDVTYNSNLDYNSQLMGGKGTTTRTELNGLTQKDGSDLGYKLGGTSDEIRYRDLYGNVYKDNTVVGTLKAPRAGWNIGIYGHGTDSYTIIDDDLKNRHTSIGNQNYSNFIESTFVDWYRPKEVYDNGLTLDVFPSANNIKITNDVMMLIPRNHSIYATYENNNNTVIGVPGRKYTITFDTCGGEFTNSDSSTKEHNWIFEGWYNRPCEIQHTVGKEVDHQNNIGLVSTNTAGFLSNGTDTFTPTCNIDLYAHWTDPGFTLPEVQKDGYVFIGWYDKPQGDVSSPSEAIYYGGNKQSGWDYDTDKSIYNIDSNTTLYAWFNRKPVFVDIYEGLFFEGQSVTYNDLIELIGVYDYEDNYIELQTQVVQDFFNGLIQKIDQDIATDENDIEYLVQEKDLWIFEHDPEDDGYDPSELEELDEKLAALRDHLAHLLEQKEDIEKERAYKLGSITDRAKLLTINISEIDYYKTKEEIQIKDDYRVYEETSLTSSGIYKVEDNAKDNYENMYLKTRTENIGKFDVTYQVRDEGIQFINVLTGNIETIPNSDITLEYTRRCQINFNYNPLLYIQGVIDYSSVTDIAQSTLKQQAAFDSEDTQDNIPWWDKDTSDTDLLLHTEYNDTIQKMQDTIVITGISNYKFSSAFENEHPDAVQAFKNEFNSPEYSNNAEQHFSNTSLGNYYVPNKGMTQIYDKYDLLNYISSFKGDSSDYHGVTKDQIWRALRGISVTIDAHDQWGKWASNNVSEENYTKPDREVDTSGRPDGYIPEYNGDNDLDENGGDEYDDKIIQNEEERTTEIILIDDSGDVETIDGSINLTRISSKIRYISNKYLNTLSENSFWGSTGVNTIKEILNKNSVDDTISHSGTYKTETDNTVEVKVKD